MRDTHPDIERVHIEMLRQAGATRRSQIRSDLTCAAMRRAKAGIARAHPEMKQQELDLLFVRVHYGRDLADRVQLFLDARAAEA